MSNVTFTFVLMSRIMLIFGGTFQYKDTSAQLILGHCAVNGLGHQMEAISMWRQHHFIIVSPLKCFAPSRHFISGTILNQCLLFPTAK